MLPALSEPLVQPLSPATAWDPDRSTSWCRSSLDWVLRSWRWWGTNVGAGQHERALRVAWIGGFMAAAMCALIGALAAVYPRVWLGLFDNNPAMLAAGSEYLHRVGPFYGFFGLGLGLYFAFQGFGRLRWAVLANFTRLTIAVGGGLLALRLTGDLSFVFVALSVGLVAFGLINATALASGAVTAGKASA